MPKELIIIGGPSRSGTNTVSCFLHLHDDVLMWHTFGAGHLPDSTDVVGDMAKSFPDALQKVPGDERLYAWKKVVEDKNTYAAFRSDHKPEDVKYWGLRWDYAERQSEMIRERISIPVKFVYCMRPLIDVFCSQAFAGYFRFAIDNDSWQAVMDKFAERMDESFDGVLALKEMGFPIYPYETTDSLGAVIDFIGIQSNELQHKWLMESPVTNFTNNKNYEVFKKILRNRAKVPEQLQERYDWIKRSLLRRGLF